MRDRRLQSDEMAAEGDGPAPSRRRLFVRAAGVAIGMLVLLIGGLAILSLVSGEPFLPMDYGAFD